MSAKKNKNKISRKDKYTLLGSMCYDRKEIECKMLTGSTQFMMPLAKDVRSQFKPNRVEARTLFCPFRAFPKLRFTL